MTQWQITSSEGVDMGVYEGATAKDALDAMSRDAGYRDHASACEVTGENPGSWTSDAADFERGGLGLLVAAVQS